MKFNRKQGLILFLSVWFSTPSFANDEYYTVDEDLSLYSQTENSKYSSFNEFVSFSAHQFMQTAQSLAVKLLRWNQHDGARPLPSDPYQRKLHFGRWINDPYDDSCMNTRARVLVRDSESNVTYRNEKNCVVDSGRWDDPYAGGYYNYAKDIQIDHMVPLKNAYMAGAWRWDYKTRCLYANYMGFQKHLVPASGSENMSKGDRGPENYIPPNTGYRCQYIKDWLSIKLIWGLTMSKDEVAAIDEIVRQENCDTSSFEVSQRDLNKIRQDIQSNLDYCMINSR
jgi:hypothetical protein